MLNGHGHEQVPAPVNPAWHKERVRIRRTGRGFCAGGKYPELGETVICDKFTALGLIKMGKAAWVDDGTAPHVIVPVKPTGAAGD